MAAISKLEAAIAVSRKLPDRFKTASVETEKVSVALNLSGEPDVAVAIEALAAFDAGKPEGDGQHVILHAIAAAEALAKERAKGKEK